MIPLLLFLIACVLVYLGTLQAAFSAMMRLSLRLVAERTGRGEVLGRYLDDPLLFFIPARFLIGLAVVFTVVLLGRAVGLSSSANLLIVLGSSAAILLFCEHIIPTLIARRDPEQVLSVLLPSFVPLARLVHPLTLALARLRSRRERTAVVVTNGEEAPTDAAEAYFEAGEQEGLIEGDERKLIQSIFQFGDTLVREVMTPRPDVVAIRADATVAELRTLLRDQTYSRIPVYRESLDNILGMVVVKDLVQLTGEDGRRVDTILRPVYFVPETKKVSDLLKEFQRQRVQIAIVVDEYGGTAGLVSLEDLIEEIVGEIRDEYDEETEPVTDEGNGVYVFSGKVNIDAVVERLGVEIEHEGFETVGGFVLSNVGRVPAVGEKFDVDGLSIEVLEAERRRVHKVRISRRQPAISGEGA